MVRKINPSRRLLFRLSHLMERTSSYAQGKGYGTSTIKQEVKVVRRLLGHTPALAVDIGAHIGDYTAELLESIPGMEIHLFEPSAVNIDKLRARFPDAGNVKLVPCGVSNCTGTATLYSNRPGSGLSSLTKRELSHFNIEFDHSETIRTTRFETYWIEQLHRRPIDIVKIDIEGHELAALQGFGEAARAVRVIQFEFGGCNIDTRTYFRDFWYFFQEMDFDIYRVTPLGLQGIERYRESDEAFSATNFIAVKRALVA